MPIKNLEAEAYEAGGRCVLNLYDMYGKAPVAAMYRGYALAFCDAYAAVAGPRAAAELFYALADSQITKKAFDADAAGITAALESSLRRGKAP